MDSTLYFKQLLSGKDFAVGNQIATQMVNFVYMIGDAESRKCLLVDPTYGIDDLLNIAQIDDLQITGVLLTHYHADHAGGNLFGSQIEGSKELLEKLSIPIHCNKDEVPWLLKTSGLNSDDLESHESGDTVSVGNVEIKLIGTPGHTPGSQCFLVNSQLIAGDTLFLDGCGRTDLPGSDPELMYDSLINKLNKLNNDIMVYPGHFYSKDPFDNLGNVKSYNPVLKPRTPQEWLAIFS